MTRVKEGWGKGMTWVKEEKGGGIGLGANSGNHLIIQEISQQPDDLTL